MVSILASHILPLKVTNKVLNFLFKIPPTYFFKIQTFSFDEVFGTYNSNRITKRKF